VASAAIRGENTLAELNAQYDVHASQITQWKSELIGRATEVFAMPAGSFRLSYGSARRQSGR
jgi:transposase